MNIRLAGCVLIIIALLISPMAFHAYAEWPGVDEAVVKKFAEEAGRPPREPYINTTDGDMLLFCFLIAGTVGGFVLGYNCRGLFPPKRKQIGG